MTFKELVYKEVAKIPVGKVSTYGQIAAKVGSPRAARAVGGALHFHNIAGLPWWRVINSKGIISTQCEEHSKDLQKALLEKEGIQVNQDYKIHLESYINI